MRPPATRRGLSPSPTLTYDPCMDIVDAHGYVLEPPNGAMLRFAPAKFRDRIWHIETRADGSEWLHYNGGVRPVGAMSLAGTAGMTGRHPARGLGGQARYCR